jgi:hypothetical protein
MPTLFRWSFLLLLFVASCSLTQKTAQVGYNANQAFLNKEYENALTLYTQYMKMSAEDPLLIPDSIYRNAGLAAFHLQKKELSLEYLNRIRNSETANAETQYALAKLNRGIDNLSREITALENYVNDYPNGNHIDEMRNRLFQTWVESRNFDRAFDLWPSIEQQASQKEHLLNDYFTTIKELEKEELLFDTAQDLLRLNSENTDALHFLAVYYFNKAENRYQTEMDAYEKNRTRRQYAQLLKGFEVLNKDFSESLDYFLKLFEIDPQPGYARYIGNIYLRFDDKEKARIYHEKAND